MNPQIVRAAFNLTMLAGLSTGIGSALILFTKKTNVKLLSVCLGLSAGVMIYVSFVEIFPSANNSLVTQLGKLWGSWITILSFLGGIILTAVIDRLVPLPENPHEAYIIEKANLLSSSITKEEIEKNRKLLRIGYFSAVAIAIHNIPEGLAVFATVLKDLSLGMTIAVAVAIHNIPEGIAVAVPIYCATGSRKKAFFYSFLSGLTELFGALVGYFILLPFLNEILFGIVFAFVAGIMVFISFDELLPAAREYGEHHLSIYGLILGMVIMAISLIYF